MDNRVLIGGVAIIGLLFVTTRNANAGIRYDGGYVPDPGPLPDFSGVPDLAIVNFNAFIPSAADYEDALPGSVYYEPTVIPDWTSADQDDLDAGSSFVDWWTNDDNNIVPTGAIVNGEKNLKAILAAIRWAEGTADVDGYRALYGYRPGNGKLFDSFADHPRIRYKTPWGTTSAAGAYQMQAGTWDDAANALGLTDFSPENQDKAAVWIIDAKRKALADIFAGRINAALLKLRKEWASLPTSDSGQPKRNINAFLQQYLSYGGDVSVMGDDTTFA